MRSTEVIVMLAGADVSAYARENLLNLSYSDGEGEDAGADDLQIKLADRTGFWLNYMSSFEDAGKGEELSAVIIGAGGALDCGIFEIDSVDHSGPPGTINIKGTSIPHTTKMRCEKKTKAWENLKLSAIANEIASNAGLTCMYESKNDPMYKRKEQVQKTDIDFLQSLCDNTGLSMKVTSKKLVIYDTAEYEKKGPVYTVAKGGSDFLKWRISTNFKDCNYSSCVVSYYDPKKGKTIKGEYKPPKVKTKGNKQVLKINEKVETAAEAKELAKKRFREKNQNAYKASFTVMGNCALVAGAAVQVAGFGPFDGKYLIEDAKHTVDGGGGYVTDITVHMALEE